MKTAPEWQAYAMPNYHPAMAQASTALQQRILVDSAYRSFDRPASGIAP
ncbi:hypothetical protein NOLU111490_12805 [Novosphingobium lubricantis]|uniref:Uncharacterized protein n=1 Tax=Novosphingobium pentaromativorans US6-1 TaxID=1088721 RepID=G6EJZ5_9SPHN|nr:hypothetical protein [Novosphingobium pentaromativorans]EHJ58397.1 hypothetical protein NSU_4666 [Novosphingobium pentaromativorans US6-1]